jgi:hypothetical protein
MFRNSRNELKIESIYGQKVVTWFQNCVVTCSESLSSGFKLALSMHKESLKGFKTGSQNAPKVLK